MTTTPLTKPAEKPPSEDRLVRILSTSPDAVEPVQLMIQRHNLPYHVVVDPNTGLGTLHSNLSGGDLHLSKFLTENKEMLEMKSEAAKIAKTEHEVLITGETGTGKELIAKSMIANRQGMILAVNCAGLPETLIESELFGYERGAFTGAAGTKDGLITAANDGVLFLDEIGELPLSVQAKLLRALQEKRIRKVGSLKDEKINCKFVCATHRDLWKMVMAGLFRKDLYARISTLELCITPIRERVEDIPVITKSLPNGEQFFNVYGKQMMDGLLELPFNIRSIQQYVIQYTVLGKIKPRQKE